VTSRRERALELAKAAGAKVLLAARPSSVTWLSGHAVDVETGPSPFALWPLVLVEPDGGLVAIASEDDAPDFERLGCRVVSFPGFTVEPLDPTGNARCALSEAIGGRRVATEPGWLPAALAEGHELVDVADAIVQARAVKDADELARIRAAVEVCDAGQRAARDHARPGISELELWSAIRPAMELAAGGRIPALADLVSGPKTEHVGGPPGDRVLEKGDLVICDLVPRVDGYWGDSCATIAVGEPDAKARGRWEASHEALARGLDAIRPGIVAHDLDTLVRGDLDYPHHTGHGLGCDFHEEPRIVAGSRTVLEPGMVVALEPGSYGEGSGLRCELVAVVTDDGCDVLSRHELEL
jgi:Xaa-Pro aminopeptidase